VGFDYVLKPQMRGHFYEYGKPWASKNQKPFSVDLFESIDADIKISALTFDDRTSDTVQCIKYWKEPVYRENYEIIDLQELNKLNKFNMLYSIFPNNQK